MKTNKWLILLLVFCGCANDNDKFDIERGKLSFLPEACFPEVSDKYIYPIVPGMDEWNAAYDPLNDVWNYDPIIFCQLPDDVLKSISTVGLIDALIHAPLFTGFYGFSSSLSVATWRGHYTRFNSGRELFQREDAGDALVAYYNLVSYDCCITPSIYYGEGERIFGLEFLFTKQEILDKIGHAKKKEAVAAIVKNFEHYPSYSIFPMAYLLLADEYPPIVEYAQNNPEEVECILQGYFYTANSSAPEQIISFAKSFINDN